MNNNVILDTNILFDLFTNNPYQQPANNCLQDKQIHIYKGVLEELFNLLKNRFDSDVAADKINYILQSSHLFTILDIPIKDIHAAVTLTRFNRSKDQTKNLSLTDGVQVFLSSKGDFTLYTRDERMTLFDNVVKPY